MITVKVGQTAPAAASECDMNLVNEYALTALSPKDVKCYTLKVCNNQIDRDSEAFSHEVLQDFAATLPGKGLLEGHAWGPVGVGLFYKSWLATEGGVEWLYGKCFLPTAPKDSAEMISKLDSGIAKWCSIGFYAPDRVPTTEYENGKAVSFTEYRRGANGEQAETLEVSMVFLGAQYDAAVVKAFQHAGAKSLSARLERATRSKGFSFLIPRS